MESDVAKAELHAAAFFSEHNIAFSSADHFTDMCKMAFKDSETAKNMQMKRTKMTYLIQDGIAFHEEIDLNETLRETKFSIIIDESTDISVTQVLAVVVRFFDKTKRDVRDVFFDSITVEDGSLHVS